MSANNITNEIANNIAIILYKNTTNNKVSHLIYILAKDIIDEMANNMANIF